MNPKNAKLFYVCSVLACILPASTGWATATPVPDPGGNSTLVAAHACLGRADARFDEGMFEEAYHAANEAGRWLYLPGDFSPEDNRQRALLQSRLSLLTVRLNQILFKVSTELEPERFNFPIPYNTRIEREIDAYLTVSREEFARWLRRSGRYLRVLQDYFRSEGLPEDLVYVALVESGFNPRNRSHKEAVGLFQFILSTGEMVGLKNDHWIDERRDPGKAAQAAVKHLRSLYKEFNDWDLALAAYNAGSGRVWQSIRAQGGTRDYWKLILPLETERYVPRFYAALAISREPQLYGFNPVLEEEQNYEEVPVPGGVDFKVVASCIGVSTTVVSDLNTELTKSCTPPGPDPYPLRLPPGSAERFSAAFAALPERQKILSAEEIAQRKFKGVYVIYKVRSGDNLFTIARRHRTTVAKLQQWNAPLRNRKFIHPGDSLRIYRVQ